MTAPESDSTEIKRHNPEKKKKEQLDDTLPAKRT
jgi:hypothetical protein